MTGSSEIVPSQKLTEVDLSNDPNETLALYRSMQRIRRVEESLIAEYHPANEMRCPIHFCVGQEATPAALGLHLTAEDFVICHYRSHGYFLAKGAPMAAMVAEFYGKATGANHGVAGSMELAYHESRFYSGAIVGGPAGLATGTAYAQKYLKSHGISIAVFGDGAMDEGVSYEAINLAALHDLPILFLCENNRYAAHTPLARRTHATDTVSRAAAFGVETATVEDSDSIKLNAQIAAHISSIRKSGKPLFLEVGTYRFCGHVGPESDDEMAYRPTTELKQRMLSDPLRSLRQFLETKVARAQLADIDTEIEAEIAAAIASAKLAKFPEAASVQSIVSAGTYDPIVKELIEGAVGDFKGAQPESKLAPY